MSIVVLKLPDVKQRTEERPKKCPYFKGMTFQRWGSTKKKVQDVHVRSIAVYRYRCCHYKRTFRHFPLGVRQLIKRNGWSYSRSCYGHWG